MPSVGRVNGKFRCFELTNSSDLISRGHDSSPEDRPGYAQGAVPGFVGWSLGGLEPGGSQLRCGRGEGTGHAP